jgi:hypothetical protein
LNANLKLLLFIFHYSYVFKEDVFILKCEFDAGSSGLEWPFEVFVLLRTNKFYKNAVSKLEVLTFYNI